MSMLEGVVNLARRIKDYFFGDRRKDFSKLNISTDNKYKFFGLSKNKNIMKELTKIKITNQ